MTITESMADVYPSPTQHVSTAQLSVPLSKVGPPTTQREAPALLLQLPQKVGPLSDQQKVQLHLQNLLHMRHQHNSMPQPQSETPEEGEPSPPQEEALDQHSQTPEEVEPSPTNRRPQLSLQSPFMILRLTLQSIT